jgi:hypothetical protein
VSEFEYTFTGVTIVLALAIARLLEGLRDTFDRDRRFWIHYLWVVNRLALALGLFWAAFDARDRADQDFVFFLTVAMPPAVMVLQANALVTPQAATIEDWKAHFWCVRRWFFGCHGFLAVALLLSSSSNAAEAMRPLLAIGLLVSVVGYMSSNERIHGLLAVIDLSIVAIGFAGLALE